MKHVLFIFSFLPNNYSLHNCQIRKRPAKGLKSHSMIPLKYIISLFWMPCACLVWVDVLWFCVKSSLFFEKVSCEKCLVLIRWFWCAWKLSTFFQNFLLVVCHVLLIVNSGLISFALFFLVNIFLSLYSFHRVFTRSDIFLTNFFNCQRFSPITDRYFDPS